jgi:hypothetical protein
LNKNNPENNQSEILAVINLALIPHDKDHAGDPMSFVPIFHSESTWIEIFQQCKERHLKKRNESSKQRDEDHHASNLSLIILDEHKNLHSNIFDKHGSAVLAGTGAKLTWEVFFNLWKYSFLVSGNGARKRAAGAKLTCSRQSLCVVNDQPVGNPKRKV